ncbi:MAG TPA: pseudouridine synthase [Candidatus Sulfotelmatobacter sp.]|nr:pseudouridine synthase [Candidatus Sulfotelmatobacter sp.]
MRINRYVASALGLSRRKADQLITEQKVDINGHTASLGDQVNPNDKVSIGPRLLSQPKERIVIALNKPVGYVCSRDGQGSKTIYELLPDKYSPLKCVGRLDKDSTGIILLTNDGVLANQLMHPSFNKEKVYLVSLNKPLTPGDQRKIQSGQVMLDNRPSRFIISSSEDNQLKVTLSEGRNRQIRRTFALLGYRVNALKRTSFGEYSLGDIAPGKFKIIS